MKQAKFLSEGITGKQLVQAQRDTNNSHKAEGKSISFCIKQLIKHDQSFLTSFKAYNPSDLTPANLCPLVKGKEGAKGYSVWLTSQLVKRYYAAK